MKSSDDKVGKEIKTFAAASFLNDLGSDMIYPIWPLFVTSILGANMTALGLLDGLGKTVVSLAQAASGYLSDRFKRRKIFIWIGYLLGAASRIGYAVSSIWHHLIPFRILDRAGKIRSAPRDAFVSDLSNRSNRGRNFGILRAMDNLGAVFGVLVCILLFDPLGYRNLFLLASIPSIIGSIAIFKIIKEKKLEVTKLKPYLRWNQLNTNFKLFLFLSAFFSLSTFSYSFLLIYAHDLGFESSFVPVLYLLYTIIASLSTLPFGKLADRWNRKSVFTASLIFWIMVCTTLLFFHSYNMVWVAFSIYGLHLGALEPVQKTFVAELAPEDYKASGIGIYQMIVGICALPASFIAGFLWEGISKFAPLYFSMLLALCALVILIFVKEDSISESG